MGAKKKCFRIGDLVSVESRISAVSDVSVQAGGIAKGGKRTGVVVYAGNNFITVKYCKSAMEPRSEEWCESFTPFDFFGISKAG